jgi:hypothetical protein
VRVKHRVGHGQHEGAGGRAAHQHRRDLRHIAMGHSEVWGEGCMSTPHRRTAPTTDAILAHTEWAGQREACTASGRQPARCAVHKGGRHLQCAVGTATAGAGSMPAWQGAGLQRPGLRRVAAKAGLGLQSMGVSAADVQQAACSEAALRRASVCLALYQGTHPCLLSIRLAASKVQGTVIPEAGAVRNCEVHVAKGCACGKLCCCITTD